MKYSNIISTVAKELDLSEELVSKTYDAYWKYIRENIQNLPLKEELSQEEFNKLKTNFNIPSIGKLSCTYNRYLGVKQRYKRFKSLQDVYNKEN